MRALVITEHGPPEVLRVLERPDPEPGPGEVRIAVKAAGINFADLLARLGFYPDAPKPPCVVGYEVAGQIESLGEGVDGFAVGDRVMAGARFGGYAELVVARANAKQFEILKRYTVADSATWAQPVLSGQRVFVKDVSSISLWTLN